MPSLRNAVLEADFAKKGFKLPKARKTGTTIAGVVYKVSLDRPTVAVTDLLTVVRPLGLKLPARTVRVHHENRLLLGNALIKRFYMLNSLYLLILKFYT